MTESEPLLIDIEALSKLLNRSESSLHRDDRRGRLPKGFKIGGSKRWRLEEIHAWVRAGMPSRVEWMTKYRHKWRPEGQLMGPPSDVGGFPQSPIVTLGTAAAGATRASPQPEFEV